MLTIFLAISSFVLASSSFAALQPYSVPLRAIGILLILSSTLFRRSSQSSATDWRPLWAFFWAGLGFILYVSAAQLAHGRAAAFLVQLLIVVVLLGLVRTVYAHFTHAELLDGLYYALIATCVSSIVSFFALPSVALEAGRLRGVTENANTLGFMAFILVAISVIPAIGYARSILGISLALSCVVLSASRSSLISLLVVLVLSAVLGSRTSRAALGAILSSVSIAWLLFPSAVASATIFRVLDSRSNGSELARFALDQSFWTGLGETPAPFMVAGSVFTASIVGGLIGLFGLIAIYLGFFFGVPSHLRLSRVLVTAAMFHSLFESWVLSFSSPLFLVFSCTLVLFIKSDLVGKAESCRSATAGASARET